MSNLYWFISLQRKGTVWQKILKNIVKASIQVKMSAISTTRFLDPYSTSFLSKNAWGLTSWALILSGSRWAMSTKKPAKIFRNKLIKDWSIARTHHKSFVEAWKRGGHRSGRATVRALNHYRQVCGGRGGKSRDNRRTIKWDVSWNIQGHNKRTWRLGGRAGSTGARGCRIMSWIRRTRRRSHVCVPATGILKGK